VDLKDIKAIIDLMKKNSIAEFEMEKEGFKIRLKRGVNGTLAVTPTEDVQTMAYPIQSSAPVAAVMPTSLQASLPVVSSEIEIKSPMVGTFYRAPSPESAPYVDVGADLNPETVVCIIEAMKVMNEIKSEVKGVISQVLAENGKPVEFGQPLFKVRPA
jgi:acetyl-CoA carboxylase biotin carboxyl carrier protein